MSTPDSAPSILSFLTGAAPSLLVIVGWIIVNEQNNSRESRKEERSRVDAFKKSLNELELLAFDHHIKGQDPTRTLQIRRSISRVSSEMQMLQNCGMKLSHRGALVAALRQSITLKNFDTSSYVVQQMDSEILSDIGVAIDKLTVAAEAGFSEKYAPSKYARYMPFWR